MPGAGHRRMEVVGFALQAGTQILGNVLEGRVCFEPNLGGLPEGCEMHG